MTLSAHGITQIALNTQNQDAAANGADEEVVRTAHGYFSKEFSSDANLTLSSSTSPPEFSYKKIKLLDTAAFLTAGRSVIIPAYHWCYIFENATAQALSLVTSVTSSPLPTGYSVPALSTALVICDGTDCHGHVIESPDTSVVQDDSLTQPPNSSPQPAIGACYIVNAGSPAGAWAGFADQSIAYHLGSNSYLEITPATGQTTYSLDSSTSPQVPRLLVYNGTAWVDV